MLRHICSIAQQRDFLKRPNVIGNPRSHRWRDSQRLVDSREIVMQEVNRHHVRVILDFLGKTVCQASKAAHRHAHR